MLHGNAKITLYDINYQLCSSIQAMGCVQTEASTLTGFLDLPSSGKIGRHLQLVEKVLGPIQEQKK